MAGAVAELDVGENGAGIVGSFGREYDTRTSIGGVDTDALNLTFPILLSLLILLACTAERVRQVYVFSALAGLTAFVSDTWCFHPSFSLAYLVMLVLCLLAHRKGWKTVALALAPSWLASIGLALFATFAVSRWKQMLPLALALAAFALFYSGGAAGFVPRPTLSNRTAAAFAHLKDVLPRRSVVLTSWDYGYPLTALGGLATYHDGSYHSLNSYLIHKALSATRQGDLYGTAAYIDALGEKRIRERMEASSSPAEGRIDCTEATIDVRDGFVERTLPMKKLVLIVNGKVTQKTDYPHDDGLDLHVLADDPGANAYFLSSERVFRSNFNQLDFLGRFDPSLFDQAYVDFPTVRVFRLRRNRREFVP